MYQLIGPKEILKDLYRLSKSTLGSKPSNRSDLIIGFRKFLKKFQPKVPQPEGSATSLLWEPEDVKPFLEIFEEDSILDDFDMVFSENRKYSSNFAVEWIKRSLDKMKNIDLQFYELIGIVIHTIFSAPSQFAGGGSTSAAVGSIWMDLRSHWKDQDVLEFLIHETVHNLIFVDEICRKHYLNYQEIAKEENFPVSAIRNKPRPLDKVFHSIIVAVEVLQFRSLFLGHPEKPCLHPPTDIMIDQTKRSIETIRTNAKITDLMTDRSTFLLEKSSETLSTVESSISTNV